MKPLAPGIQPAFHMVGFNLKFPLKKKKKKIMSNNRECLILVMSHLSSTWPSLETFNRTLS